MEEQLSVKYLLTNLTAYNFEKYRFKQQQQQKIKQWEKKSYHLIFLLGNNLIKTIDESWVYKNEGLCQLP